MRWIHAVRIGDRVVSNGPDAELVAVPETLVARIPEPPVTFESAAFTPLAVIGLHNARLAAPTLGERFAVIGLGLVGLLAVQVLQAHGCEVLGIDPDGEQVRLARELGARGLDTSATQWRRHRRSPMDAVWTTS